MSLVKHRFRVRDGSLTESKDWYARFTYKGKAHYFSTRTPNKTLAAKIESKKLQELIEQAELGLLKSVSIRVALDVRAAHQDWKRSEVRAEEWLMMEWPENEPQPVHYWLSNLPATMALRTRVNTAMMRWRIERDYQELKQEFGLSHYEGRGWRGFHHHATLCIAAYGFLIQQRLKGSSTKKNSAQSKAPGLPEGYTPRGSRKSTAARTGLDRHVAVSARPWHYRGAGPMPMLRDAEIHTSFMTQ